MSNNDHRYSSFLSFLFVALDWIDGISTGIGLQSGRATELNPIMNEAWRHGPLWFVVAKGLLVPVLVLFLAKRHPNDARRLAFLFFVVSVYLVVLGVHLAGWIAVWSDALY